MIKTASPVWKALPRSSHIWVLGDFNLPHIDWESEQISPNCPCRSAYESYINTLHDFGLEQVVKDPTRGTNILDLSLTNRPSLVHSTRMLPLLGKGDHDIVHHELKISLGRKAQKQRHTPLYKKTDWDSFRNDVKDYQKHFRKPSQIQTQMLNGQNSKPSSRNCLKNTSLQNSADPRMDTHTIKRLMNKRDRLYAKLKQNRSNPNLKVKFKNLKHLMQNKLRESYNTYIESIVTDQINAFLPFSSSKRLIARKLIV